MASRPASNCLLPLTSLPLPPPLQSGLRCLFLSAVVLVVASCSSTPRQPAVVSSPAQAAAPVKPSGPPTWTKNKGGFYMDDGPMDASGVNLDLIPDATAALEPLHRFANRPYNVFGVDYTPQLSLDNAFTQSGIGSWYGRKFHGQRTSSGEIYDMFAMTAAHPTLPIPSYARVTNPRNGKVVVVRVNDRGPFLHNRVIDLSYAAAHRLGYVTQGSAEVRVEKLTPVLIAQLRGDNSLLARSEPVAKPPVVAAVSPLAVNPVAMPVTNPVAGASDADIAVSPAAAVAPAGSFFLQLGSFSVEDNARAFLSRLSLEFSEELPNLQVVRKEPHFRLLAGPYRSRDEAQTASRRLKQATSLAAIVVAP